MPPPRRFLSAGAGFGYRGFESAGRDRRTPYEVTDQRLDPQFLSTLLRSRYYQRAFRAITTGHSNRRRTQPDDFEDLEVAFPPDRGEQARPIAEIVAARQDQRNAAQALRERMAEFSNRIDGRGTEEAVADDEAEAPVGNEE